VIQQCGGDDAAGAKADQVDIRLPVISRTVSMDASTDWA